MRAPSIPVVMTFSSSDPTGASGIQADIEALFGLGCHCTTIITAITAQDSLGVKDNTPIATSLIIEQARAVLNDIAISAFKVGDIGSIENLSAIYTLLKDHPRIPIVLHLASHVVGSPNTPDTEMTTALTTLLCPMTTVLTVDTDTAQILTPGADTLDACAQKLLDIGCERVLIKNCTGLEKTVENTLYGNHRLLEKFSWERIKGNYRGAGCTLTASIAGLLAHGLDPTEAIIEAQKYTWDCIRQGVRLGIGSQLPNRLFWARKPSTD